MDDDSDKVTRLVAWELLGMLDFVMPLDVWTNGRADKITIGSKVHLCLRLSSSLSSVADWEILLCEVTSISHGIYRGEIVRRPQLTKRFRLGSPVEFLDIHVWGIEKG